MFATLSYYCWLNFFPVFLRTNLNMTLRHWCLFSPLSHSLLMCKPVWHLICKVVGWRSPIGNSPSRWYKYVNKIVINTCIWLVSSDVIHVYSKLYHFSLPLGLLHIMVLQVTSINSICLMYKCGSLSFFLEWGLQASLCFISSILENRGLLYHTI